MDSSKATAHITAITSEQIMNAEEYCNKYILVWLDTAISGNSDDFNQIRSLLDAVQEVYMFNDIKNCLNYLNTIKENRVFLVLSCYLDDDHLQTFLALPQIEYIYVLNDKLISKTEHPKFVVITSIQQLCSRLSKDGRPSSEVVDETEFAPLGLNVTVSSIRKLDADSRIFIMYQLILEILHGLPKTSYVQKQFIEFCTENTNNNPVEQKILEEFVNTYKSDDAISWYTRPSFLHRLINRTCRMGNFRSMLKITYFMSDLYAQLKHLHEEHLELYEKQISIYRGRSMSSEEFEKFKKSVGNLVITKSFLSSTTEREVACMYAGGHTPRSNFIPVIWNMKIDMQTKRSKSFAFIRYHSNVRADDEVVVSVGTVFRVTEEELKNGIHEFTLVRGDTEKQVEEDIKKAFFGKVSGTDVFTTSDAFTNVDKYYKQLLDVVTSSDEHPPKQSEEIFSSQSSEKINEGFTSIDTTSSVWRTPVPNTTTKRIYREIQALKEDVKHLFILDVDPTNSPRANSVKQNTISPLGSDVVVIEGRFLSMSEPYWQRPFRVRFILRFPYPFKPPEFHFLDRIYHPNISDNGHVCSVLLNAHDSYAPTVKLADIIRSVERLIRDPELEHAINTKAATDYRKDRDTFDRKALASVLNSGLTELSPSENHELAQIHYEIGLKYQNMKRYSNALKHYQMTLKIQQKSLPPDHDDLVEIHNTIGFIYYNMKNYSNAIEHYQMSHKIQQKSFPSNHDRLARTYTNIARMHNNIEDYWIALEYYQKALEIQQKLLPPDHNDLVETHNNIGAVFNSMKDHLNAKKHYQKALEIQQKSLMFDQDDPAVAQGDIDSRYNDIVENQSVNPKSVPRCLVQAENSLQLNFIPVHTDEQILKKSSDLFTLKRQDWSKVIIICLDISDEISFSSEYVERFTDEFKFVARVLSIKDKMQILLISTSTAELVVPLIHKHFSVEEIYLYSSSDDQCSHDWIRSFSKVVGPWVDYKKLDSQVSDKINSLCQQQLVWNRSNNLFAMMDHQKINNNPSLTLQISTSIANSSCFVIMHCNKPIFHVTGSLDCLKEFTNIGTCVQFITKQAASHIFLVISGDIESSDIESLLNFEQIHAIYYFCTREVVLPINTRKVSGQFNNLEDLAAQLRNDLQFYQQQLLHSSKICIFPISNSTEKLITPFDVSGVEFLIFQMFIKILPQIPTLTFTLEQTLSEWKALFIEPTDDSQSLIMRMNGDKMNVYDDGPTILKILSQIVRHEKFHNFLTLAKPLREMHENALQSNTIHVPFTVYRADIVFRQDLTTLKSNCNALVSITTFFLATRSVLAARTIARQAADNGLATIMIEVEVFGDSQVIDIHTNYMIFPVGTIFRLNSIDQGPDDVWYVKMNCVKSDLRPMIEQLHLDIGTPLTWLTFGSYLYKLNRLRDAERYYIILKEKLPKSHPDLPSIYNNMGIMYTMAGNSSEAIRYYDLAEVHARLIDSSLADRTKFQDEVPIQINNTLSLNTVIDRSSVFEHIAEICLEEKNYRLAIENYEKAFELCTDQQRCQNYQKMISSVTAILKSNK